MKQIFYIAFSSLIVIPLLAEPPVKTANENGASRSAEVAHANAVKTTLRDSRQELQEQLAQASSAQEKRQLIDVWRLQNQTMIDLDRTLRTSEHLSPIQSAKDWQRPIIPENLPAKKREEMAIHYDQREAQVAIIAAMKGKNVEERRQAITHFREQNAYRFGKLLKLSESRQSSIETKTSELLPIPRNLLPEQKAKLEASNAHILDIIELRDSLENSNPEGRRQVIETFHEMALARLKSIDRSKTNVPFVE